MVAPRDRLLVRAQEAAELLGIGRSKLYELIGTREIRPVRIGRGVRFSMRALTEYAERLQREQAGEGAGRDASTHARG